MVMSERLTNWKPISSVSRSAIIADRGAKSRGGSVSGVPPFTASSPNLVSNAAARTAAASARRREARARPLPPAPFHARHAHVISARRLKDRSWREQSSHRGAPPRALHSPRSEEHPSELQSLKRHSYAVFC